MDAGWPGHYFRSFHYHLCFPRHSCLLSYFHKLVHRHCCDRYLSRFFHRPLAEMSYRRETTLGAPARHLLVSASAAPRLALSSFAALLIPLVYQQVISNLSSVKLSPLQSQFPFATDAVYSDTAVVVSDSDTSAAAQAAAPTTMAFASADIVVLACHCFLSSPRAV